MCGPLDRSAVRGVQVHLSIYLSYPPWTQTLPRDLRLSLPCTRTAQAGHRSTRFYLFPSMRTRANVAIRAFLMLSAVAAADTIKIPVEVDQQGKTKYFVTDSESVVPNEARQFCAAHLPGMPQSECVDRLVEQVSAIRKMRSEAQQSLPGITFTVNNAQGVAVKFIHEEGNDPSEEARDFCAEHFPNAPMDQCVEAMLANAGKALDEIKARHEVR